METDGFGSKAWNQMSDLIFSQVTHLRRWFITSLLPTPVECVPPSLAPFSALLMWTLQSPVQPLLPGGPFSLQFTLDWQDLSPHTMQCPLRVHIQRVVPLKTNNTRPKQRPHFHFSSVFQNNPIPPQPQITSSLTLDFGERVESPAAEPSPSVLVPFPASWVLKIIRSRTNEKKKETLTCWERLASYLCCKRAGSLPTPQPESVRFPWIWGLRICWSARLGSTPREGRREKPEALTEKKEVLGWLKRHPSEFLGNLPLSFCLP